MQQRDDEAAARDGAAAPPPKRQKRDATTSTASASGKGQNGSSSESSELAFHLTRLKSAPAAHNKYAVGVQELLSGKYTTVLLTSYMYDIPWLFGECPRLQNVPVVLVHGEHDRQAMANECRGYTNVTLVAPYLPIPYGTHHTKMMVVVYPSKVRVAIFTANFISIDWNNKTQGVWHQDFDLKTLSDDDDDDDGDDQEEEEASGTTAQTKSQLPDFEADLVAYLSCLGSKVATFCKNEITRFDFSTANVALIPSVPGVHKGKGDMDYALHDDSALMIGRLKFSSMGSLDEKWLFGEFAKSLLMGKKGVTATSAPIQALHIIWPSVDDVRNSIEGWNSGRAVPCSLKNMKPFLHKHLRKWTPPECLRRKNAMPHIKTYARFDPSDESDRAGVLDWAILTSSNLSKAAWGAFQKNDSQFMIRSYELGVLFLPQLLTKKSKASSKLVVLGSKAAEQQQQQQQLQNPISLPLPYSFPLKTYNPKEDEPWVWDVIREDPDIFGNCYLPR